MANAPAFQFYANDFMDGTRFWDANACGLYIRCMCIQWTQGGLPKDIRTLARGVGMDFEEVRTLWEVVGSKFEEGADGQLRNARLEAVRLRQQAVSTKRSDAASKRWDGHANASASYNAKNKQRKVKEKVEGEVLKSEGKERAGIVVNGFLSAEFALAFAAFENSRRSIGAKITPDARAMIVTKLKGWGEEKSIRALNLAVERGWRGLFDPDEGSKKSHGAPPKPMDRNAPIELDMITITPR